MKIQFHDYKILFDGGETREVREFLNSQNLSPETIEAIICDHE